MCVLRGHTLSGYVAHSGSSRGFLPEGPLFSVMSTTPCLAAAAAAEPFILHTLSMITI